MRFGLTFQSHKQPFQQTILEHFTPLQSTLTVEHSAAVLGGGGQGFAGGVELVAVVADADLELDGLPRVLQHGGRMEHGGQAELPPALVFLPKQPFQLSFKTRPTVTENNSNS